jgi:hypothetical protein
MIFSKHCFLVFLVGKQPETLVPSIEQCFWLFSNQKHQKTMFGKYHSRLVFFLKLIKNDQRKHEKTRILVDQFLKKIKIFLKNNKKKVFIQNKTKILCFLSFVRV